MSNKISVIIPLYNGAKYIQQALESVFQQTYNNYEIIIIDDGSTDESKQVLESYLDKVKYIYQNNQGVAAARNKGLEVATGEYIAFLDQDDYFLPEKLESQVAKLEKRKNLGLVISGWQIVNEEGEGKSAVQPWLNLPQLDTEELIIYKPVLLSAMLFRRNWLEKVGKFETNLYQTYDVELVLRLAAQGCRADWVRKALVCYRQHENNVSKNIIAQAKELELVLENFFSRKNLSLDVRKLKNKSMYQSLVWIAWRFYHDGNLTKMSEYLAKAWQYKTNSPTETIVNWVECFKTCSQEYGKEIDFYELSNTQEWKDLISSLICKI